MTVVENPQGRVCVFRKYLQLKQIFENRQEGCHAYNSSGGVPLCRSVALDVEDFGNGALETECDVVKTVGGNYQNRKLETNN